MYMFFLGNLLLVDSSMVAYENNAMELSSQTILLNYHLYMSS